MIWNINPLVGVNELKFGMIPLEVEPILGKNKSYIERSEGRIDYYYDEVTSPVLGFLNDKLVDITFGRWTQALYFDGLDYFSTQPDIFLEKVRFYDSDVKRDILGGLISFSLGLAFTDNVPLGESDHTITINSCEQIKKYLKFGPFTQA